MTSTQRATSGGGIRERQTRETHQRIYHTARRLFAERGFSETRVQDIAEELGLSSVTIFNHFGSKNALLQAVAAEYLGYFEELIQDLRDLAAGGTQGIEPYMKTAAEKFSSVPSIPRVLATDAMRMVLGERTGLEVSSRIREMLRELMAFGQEQGEVRRDLPAEHLADAVAHQIMGAFVIWMNDERRTSGELAAEVLTMVSGYVRPGSAG
jgi:AcrR family transcriptional regulator